MLKEIKYLIFVLVILLFIFFTGKYYFSDEYKKKSYRSLSNINNKIDNVADKVSKISDDTQTQFTLKMAEFKKEYLSELNMVLTCNVSGKSG